MSNFWFFGPPSPGVCFPVIRGLLPELTSQQIETTFSKGHLVKPDHWMRSKFDLIFERHKLIYFDCHLKFVRSL